MSSAMAYMPFVTPMMWVHDWWYLLLLPLALGISMIWKALRVSPLSEYWRQVIVMTIQIIVAMIVLAIALNVFVQVIVPMLPAE